MADPSGLELVIERAAVDPAFRARLLANPRMAILAEFGVELPRELAIRFVERPADVDLLIVLPDLVDDAVTGGPLSRVSGGADVGWLFGCEGFRA